MTDRELDLYAGLTGSRGATSDARTVAPAAPRPAPDDWIALVWQRFPAPVRDRYLPRAEIGEGGMGVIVEAFDRTLDRVVAVKGVRDPLGIPADERERRAREAQLSARLTHPGILPVYDTWRDADGNPWCAMLRVPAAPGDPAGRAPTLASWLDALAGVPVERRPLVELLGTFLQVGRAVAHAHERGVVHRDIKPANVLLGPSREALVADWGVAVELAHAGATANVAGTPGYAAPEQLGLDGPARADERADVYSLGVLLAELLGAPPRRGPSDPIALPARLPRELAAIVTRATARVPGDRFPDVRSLIAAVEAHMSGGLVEGLRYGPGERLAKWLRRRPAQATALIAAALMALVLTATTWRENERLRAERRRTHKQVALMHAAAAVSELAERRPDEARARAALAFEAALGAETGWQLPPGRAWAAFASRVTVSPLLWTCRVPAVPTSVRFTPASTAIVVTTTGPVAYTIPLADTHRYARRAFPGGDVMQSSTVWQMTLDPSGRWLVQAPAVDRLRILDVATGAVRAVVDASRLAPIWAFSPRGDRLALVDKAPAAGEPSQTTGSRVRVLSVPDGALLADLDSREPSIWALAFAPDGSQLVIGDRSGRSRALAVTGGARTWTGEPTGTPLAIQFAPDGQWLLSAGSDDRITRRRSATGAIERAYGIGLKFTLSLAISPDGTRFATGGQDGVLRIWDVATGERLATLGGHGDWIWNVGWSHDGRRIASAAQDGAVRVWDVEEALRQEPTDRGSSVASLAFAPDGATLAVARRDGRVELRDAGGRTRTVARAPAGLFALALDGSGALTGIHVVPGTTSTVALVHAPAPRAPLLERVRFDVAMLRGRTPRPAAALDDAGRVIAGVTRGGRVVHHGLDGGGGSVGAPRLDGALSALAVAPGGSSVALGTERGDARVIALADQQVHALPSSRRCVMSLAFSADGRSLVAGGERQQGGPACGGVTVYDLARGAIALDAQPHVAPLSRAVCADGLRHIVSAGPDGLRILRGGGRRFEPLEVHSEHVGALALSPDGRLLAWSSDARVDVWDLQALDDQAARVREIRAQSFFEFREEDARLSALPIEEAPRVR